MTRAERAIELFLQGCNCAQAVFAAFADLVGMDEAAALRLSSSFGGGLGRQREVCGAVSGMCMVLGALYGYDDVTDQKAKAAHYALVQQLCGEFRTRYGSIICREILKNAPSDPDPSPRTAEYYAQRPCARMVMTAARLLDEFIAEHPIAQ